jgi:hypothetical protein
VWDINTQSFWSLSGTSSITVDTTVTTWPVGAANPMTALGDLLYGGSGGVATKLAGDTSNTRKFLRALSSGGVAAAPAWDTLQVGDLPGTGGSSTTPGAIPVWIKITRTYSDFSANANSNGITLWTAPAGAIIHAVKIKHSTLFSGGTLGAYNIGVGISGTPYAFAGAADVHQTVSGINYEFAVVGGWSSMRLCLTAPPRRCWRRRTAAATPSTMRPRAAAISGCSSAWRHELRRAHHGRSHPRPVGVCAWNGMNPASVYLDERCAT